MSLGFKVRVFLKRDVGIDRMNSWNLEAQGGCPQGPRA